MPFDETLVFHAFNCNFSLQHLSRRDDSADFKLLAEDSRPSGRLYARWYRPLSYSISTKVIALSYWIIMASWNSRRNFGHSKILKENLRIQNYKRNFWGIKSYRQWIGKAGVDDVFFKVVRSHSHSKFVKTLKADWRGSYHVRKYLVTVAGVPCKLMCFWTESSHRWLHVWFQD